METKETGYLKLFKDVAAKINSSLDIADVLASMAEGAVKTMKVKGCAIFLLDWKEKTLRLSAASGLSDAFLNKGPVDAEKSIVETLRGRRVLVTEAARDDRVQYPEAVRKEGIASILSVPISTRQKIIGVLRIYAAEAREFTDVEYQFIEGLAEIGGLGIENARLYQHLKSDYERLMNDVHQWFDYGRVH